MKVNTKFYYSFLLSLVLIILIKIFIPQPLKNKELVAGFWIKKTHKAYRKNIVVGGDSRVYRGVSALALEGSIAANLKAINLGFSSTGYSNEYIDFLVSRLDKNASNKILILGITPHSLTKSALKNEAYHQFNKIRGFEKYRGLYLSNYLKYFSPYKLSEVFSSKFNVTSAPYYENFTSLGWVASSKTPADSTYALAKYAKTFSSIEINQETLNNLYLKIKELNGEEVSVITFRPPSTTKMEQLEDSLSGFDESLIKESLIESGAVWVDLNNSDFVSYDGSHLNYTSAEKLSKRLGQEVNNILTKK